MESTEIQARERLIEAAAKLFCRDCIRAVSVDAVARKEVLTKRALYCTFVRKDIW